MVRVVTSRCLSRVVLRAFLVASKRTRFAGRIETNTFRLCLVVERGQLFREGRHHRVRLEPQLCAAARRHRRSSSQIRRCSRYQDASRDDGKS